MTALRTIARCLCLLAPLAAALAGPAGAETYIWVDAEGHTHLTDDPARASGQQLAEDIDQVRGLWDDGLAGPPVVTPSGSGGGEDDRTLRLMRGAVQDLQRGETARATATLRSVLRLEPGRAEPHWYLALLDRQRGRYAAAERHLRAFLSLAGPELERWRVSAQRRLDALVDERRLSDPARIAPQLRLRSLESGSFRVQIDAELGEPGSAYAATVLGYLQEARRAAEARLGVSPEEPLGVVFYGKAAYQRAHAHRFSFQTVGFFDGRIHVSAPAHPSGALRSLLFHEYAHAVFREQTGGDRPYWLNEGLAEQLERESRSQPVSARSERAALNARIRAGQWIPLRRLGPSFGGLRDEDARAAYIQSILAAEWIERRTTPPERALLLQRLGDGFSADQALYQVLGLDVDDLDAALRADIQSEFPNLESRR